GIPNRFTALHHKHQFTDEQWARFIYCDKVPNLFKADSPRWMVVFVRAFQDAYGSDALAGGLLIVDTYARAIAGGNENSAQDTTMVQDALGELQDRLRCTLLTLLHTPHGAERIRGSTNIQASFDSILKVREESGSRFFGPDVSKDSGDFEEVPYGVRVHTFEDDQGAEHKGAYIEWLDGTSAQGATKPKKKQERARAEISRMLQERAIGEGAAVSVATIHDWIQGFVAVQTVRDIMHELSTNEASVFQGKEMTCIDKNGRANKKAWHYWTEVDES
ncbi:MAG TPA: AAA family ATPase, partial [Fimbriimonadaceae bacterium]|nr:AAA family ATPase [Fimbriimonadaceae bacterium]